MRTFHLTILALIFHLCPVQSHKQVSQYLSVPLPIIVKIIPITMACKNVASQHVEPSQTPPSTALANIFNFPAASLIQSQAITKLASSNG